MTSVPFGYGNLQNLEAAREALKIGIPTYVIDEVPIESRDFTGGEAKAILAELKSEGAIFVKHESDLPSLLNISTDKLAFTKQSSTEIPGHMKPGLEKASNNSADRCSR